MRLTPLAALAVVAIVAGCNSPDVSEPSPGDTYNSDVRTDPELMRAVPDTVAAGGEIDVLFPSGAGRTAGFVLERATDEGWQWRFAISSGSGPDEYGSATIWTAEEFVARNFAWDSGPGDDSTDPHLIPVPDDVEAGPWRACTVTETPALCAEFEITADEA